MERHDVPHSISGARLNGHDCCDLVALGETLGRRILKATPPSFSDEDGERLMATLREAGIRESDLLLAAEIVFAAARRVMSLRVRMPL